MNLTPETLFMVLILAIAGYSIYLQYTKVPKKYAYFVTYADKDGKFMAGEVTLTINIKTMEHINALHGFVQKQVGDDQVVILSYKRIERKF